jgi:hypothetical protein
MCILKLDAHASVRKQLTKLFRESLKANVLTEPYVAKNGVKHADYQWSVSLNRFIYPLFGFQLSLITCMITYENSLYIKNNLYIST